MVHEIENAVEDAQGWLRLASGAGRKVLDVALLWVVDLVQHEREAGAVIQGRRIASRHP